MKRLMYTGRDSIWRNIRDSVQMVKQKYPRIQSDVQLRQAITRITVETARTHRTPYLHIFIPGRDILADDLTTIPAWSGISPDMQGKLRKQPLSERQRLLDDRSAKTGQLPLSRSYAWCQRNNWLQEVEDADYDLIMATPAKSVFRDPDLVGEWTPPPRAFDGEELFPFTKVEANSDEEIEYAVNYHKRTPYTQGATVE